MKRFVCISLFLFYAQNCPSQNQSFSTKVYFSEQISTHINAYKYRIGKAEAAKNVEEVARLYKEFINEKLVGSYLDDFNVDCFDRKKNNLGDFEKPLVLLTYAEWCGPIEEQINLFNTKVDQHHEEVDFLVLIWGDKKEARKLSKPFHRKTATLYLNELRNRDEHTIRMLKHALGVPTLIMTDSSKKIIDILKLTTPFPNLYENNFESDFVKSFESLKPD